MSTCVTIFTSFYYFFFFYSFKCSIKIKNYFSYDLLIYIIFFSIFFKIIYHKIKTVESIRTQGMLKVGRRVSLDTDTPIGQAHRHPHVSRSLIKLNAVVVF